MRRTVGWRFPSASVYTVSPTSRVDKNGLAEKNGVRVGDQIIDVNGVPFDNITHVHAVEVLKDKKHLILTLRVSVLTASTIDVDIVGDI